MNKRITDYFNGAIFTSAMENLVLTDEAMIFYKSRCMNQSESTNRQLDEGIKIPKIKTSQTDMFKYRKTYDISEDKMKSIIEELKEADAIEITD